MATSILVRATWQGETLAESDRCESVEQNFYFPKDSINCEYFFESSLTTICPWKGEAHYYTIKVDGHANENAAWYYPHPKDAAKVIKDRVAFWKGVTVAEVKK